MPKMVKIQDPTLEDSFMPMPLRLTFRNKRQLGPRRYVGNRLRVKCGCCKEALEIHVDDNHQNQTSSTTTLEINGVIGTVQQWREVLLPLLGLPNDVPAQAHVPIMHDGGELLQHFTSFAAAREKIADSTKE